MDTKRILEQLMQNPVAGGALGGLAGSLLAGALQGKGGGKKLARTAVTAGGLALIGSVAYRAWQTYQASATAAGPAAAATQTGATLPPAFDLEHDTGGALKVVQAMIAAANADGIVDDAERQRILARASGSHGHLLEQLLQEPIDMSALVRDVTSRETAAEMYTASAMAV